MGFRSKLVVASLIFAGCAHPPREPLPIPERPPPPPGPPPWTPKPQVGYRLAPSALAKSPFANDEQVESPLLLGGVRAALELGGLTLAGSVTEPPLLGGVRIPDFQGSGFVFWNQHSLYRADTFLGALKPIVTLDFMLRAISFAPGFALVRGSEGERIAIDLRSKHRVPLSPPLLLDIATHDHRVLAWLETGEVLWSTDSGKSYAPVSVPQRELPSRLLVEGDKLLIELESGSRLQMTGSGAFLYEPAAVGQRKPGLDPSWPYAESPLERAIGYGIPLEPGFAAVAARGEVVTVNLATGAIARRTSAIAPSGLDCRLLELSGPGAPLMACTSSSNGTLIFADTLGERPRELLRVPPEGRLDIVAGVMLVEGRCDGTPSPTTVCVRDADGTLTSYDVAERLAAIAPELRSSPPTPSPAPKPDPPKPEPAKPGAAKSGAAKLADASAAPPKIVRWIAKQAGGALGVVLTPPGLIDVKSGQFSEFKPEFADAALALLAAPSGNRGKKGQRGVSPGSGWFATPEGELRGWQSRAAVAISREGRVLPSVLNFRELLTAGTRGIAVDDSWHVFQSLDGGHSWNETFAPPGFEGRYSLSGHCSAVGCVLGPWLREGWTVEPAQAPSHPTPAEVAPMLPSAPIPELSCTELSVPVSAETREPDSDKSDRSDGVGFGATLLPLTRGDKAFFRTHYSWNTLHANEPGDPEGLRAFGYGQSIGAGAFDGSQTFAPDFPGLTLQRSYSYVAPFDPRASVLKASTDFKSLLRAITTTGGDISTLSEVDAEQYPTQPVLGRGPGATAGVLLLQDGPHVWLQEPARAEVFALSGELADASVVSALASDAHTLTLLVEITNGGSVLEVKGGQARRLFALPNGPLPTNPDALALGPGGKLAVVRTRSGHEPASELDPALLLIDGAAPEPLAPWSTVQLADTPACAEAADDYRLLLQTAQSWLKLVDSGLPTTTDAGLFAIARVNKQRWCLEAVELGHDPIVRDGEALGTRVVARFVGKNKGAARIALEPGFELRQPLTCSIKH